MTRVLTYRLNSLRSVTSTMRMTRVLAPPPAALPSLCEGVYLMNVGPFLSEVAFSSDPATPATCRQAVEHCYWG